MLPGRREQLQEIPQSVGDHQKCPQYEEQHQELPADVEQSCSILQSVCQPVQRPLDREQLS